MSYHAKDEKPDDVIEDSGANYAKEMLLFFNCCKKSLLDLLKRKCS